MLLTLAGRAPPGLCNVGRARRRLCRVSSGFGDPRRCSALSLLRPLASKPSRQPCRNGRGCRRDCGDISRLRNAFARQSGDESMNLVQIAISAALLVACMGSIIGDHICSMNNICGKGSGACFSAAQCTYCNGASVTDMCKPSPGSTCSQVGNVPCGSTLTGTCVTIGGGGGVGTCMGTVPGAPTCSVLKC